MHSVPILQEGARIGGRINRQHVHTTGHTCSISEDITSTLPFARQPVISTINESFESTENSVDIHQPPPHVVNYWYNQLGLALDPTSSENPPNATGSSSQFPLFDGIIYVS